MGLIHITEDVVGGTATFSPPDSSDYLSGSFGGDDWLTIVKNAVAEVKRLEFLVNGMTTQAFPVKRVLIDDTETYVVMMSGNIHWVRRLDIFPIQEAYITNVGNHNKMGTPAEALANASGLVYEAYDKTKRD